MFVLILKKRHIKGEKHITQMNFAEKVLGQLPPRKIAPQPQN